MFTSHSSDSSNDVDDNLRHVLSSSPTPPSPSSKQQAEMNEERQQQQRDSSPRNESPSPSVTTPSPVSSSSSASSSSFFDMRDDDKDYTRVPTAPLKSVKDIGFVEDQNARFRRTMEDGHIMIDGFRGRDYEGYYAIYDGHGGKTAVTHVQKVMHKIFERELNTILNNMNNSQQQVSHEEAVQQAFANAYRMTDDELKDAQYNGTTAITCYLTRDDQTNSKVLYTANCGDARVVVSVNGEAKRLTFDHKASEESEVSRIRNSNGFVAYCRVNGILAVTRALGDHAMKQWVISEPYQTSIRLRDDPNDDSFVILACDGLWDVFNDQECVDYVRDLFAQHLTCQQVSKKLLEKALEKGSTDNISIIVIKL